MSAPTKVVEARKRRKLGASGVLAASQGKPLESRQLQSRKLTNKLGIIINVILVFLFPFHSTLGLIGYTEKLSYSISMPAPQCACLFISKRERGGSCEKGKLLPAPLPRISVQVILPSSSAQRELCANAFTS